jgi:hypothetical protein
MDTRARSGRAGRSRQPDYEDDGYDDQGNDEGYEDDGRSNGRKRGFFGFFGRK